MMENMICANPMIGVEYNNNKNEYDEYHDMVCPVSPSTYAVNKVNPPDNAIKTIRLQMDVKNAFIAIFIATISDLGDPICIPPNFLQI